MALSKYKELEGIVDLIYKSMLLEIANFIQLLNSQLASHNFIVESNLGNLVY